MKRYDLNEYVFLLEECTTNEAQKEAPSDWKIVTVNDVLSTMPPRAFIVFAPPKNNNN